MIEPQSKNAFCSFLVMVLENGRALERALQRYETEKAREEFEESFKKDNKS